MLNSIVPATIVIDKPKAGIVSTKSSTAQWIDEDYFGGTPCSDLYPEPGYKDSDCGGYPDNTWDIRSLTSRQAGHSPILGLLAEAEYGTLPCDKVRSEYTTDYELAEDQLERAVHERNSYPEGY